ncbi:UNVERIFIED_CONTAM: Pre-mRNA-splicing factor SLU7, partial [Eudyptes robustus]
RMATPNLPISAVLKQGSSMGDEFDQRRTKDEYRKQKDLEEQRKAGTAPAMVDVETGRDINPHIPEFIEKTPWYIPHSGPTLQHQRPHPERQKMEAKLAEWYPRGTTGRVATKFRKGACENCGAMGHKKKDCFERPRSKGANKTESNIAADDYVAPKLELGYDAKRDRWNGYDASNYKEVAQDYEQMEETRKLIKNKNIQDGVEDAPEVEQDEDKYADDAAPAQSVDMDSRTRITVRNLRIREDTAKYLYNLDPNGPYYDPKSRSMRENPFAGRPGKEQEAAKFAGENFVRYTGEVVDANKAQVFAWGAKRQGIDVHALAEPTKLEQLRKEYEKESSGTKDETKQKLLEKYGGEEHLKAPPKELLLAQTENYVEYNRKGKVIKGIERAAIKSKYEEDVHPGNHTSVFGSWYKNRKWGYKCCHSTIKNSYCLGEQGIELEQQLPSDQMERRINAFKKTGDTEKKVEKDKQERKKDKKAEKKDEEEGKKKDKEVKKAIKKLKKQKLEAIRENKEEELNERKRKYNSHYEEFGKKPTEAETEAYNLTKTISADPMAAQVEE